MRKNGGKLRKIEKKEKKEGLSIFERENRENWKEKLREKYGNFLNRKFFPRTKIFEKPENGNF